MNEKEKNNKKKKRLEGLGGLLLVGMALVILFLCLAAPNEGWFSKKSTIEGVITKVDFTSGSFLEASTVIITFENGDIKQFRNTNNATFRLGIRHIITYKKTCCFDRIIDLRRVSRP